jgi:thiol-disulfide isomerase/thioredoxin
MACESKVYNIDTLSKGKPVALIFLGTECPISQKYIPRINQLAAAYPQLQFIGVFSAKETSADIREFYKNKHLKIKMIRDNGAVLLRRLKPTHTPEVYFLATNQQVLYFGAIDNWYYDLEQLHREPTDPFLKNAIDSYLQQKPILVKDTRPVGCRIEQ